MMTPDPICSPESNQPSKQRAIRDTAVEPLLGQTWPFSVLRAFNPQANLLFNPEQQPQIGTRCRTTNERRFHACLRNAFLSGCTVSVFGRQALLVGKVHLI